ncbi:MAG: site-2 protease family protein [Spirochaetaceae bacterium]|nr:MAG: site-2 protease family protein [Spirochaetaceae bacterium]
MFDPDLRRIALVLPAVLVGFTIHEFSHALVAVRLGDSTPKDQGRLTLNPIYHIELIGLIMILFLGFGWAKPVQINPRNFKNPRNDEILVSLAGPFSNLLFGVIFAVVVKILFTLAPGMFYTGGFGPVLFQILSYFVWINLLLAVFNLFPIPPLDGSHILLSLIPDRFAQFKLVYTRYGRFALIALILLGSFTGYNLLPIGFLTAKLYDGLFSLLGM